jgi:hypothetical protein
MFYVIQREKNQEKKCGGKNIHPYRVKVTRAPADHILPGKESGFGKKVLDRYKKFAVKMSNIGEKMLNELPDALFGLQVLLSTGGAKPALSFGSAVQTCLFCSYLAV